MMSQDVQAVVIEAGFAKINERLASLSDKQSITKLNIETTYQSRIEFDPGEWDQIGGYPMDSYGCGSTWYEENTENGSLSQLVRKFAQEIEQFTNVTELTLKIKCNLLQYDGFGYLRDAINTKLLKLKQINVRYQRYKNYISDDEDNWTTQLREDIKKDIIEQN